MKRFVLFGLLTFMLAVVFIPAKAQVYDAPPYDGAWKREHVADVEPIPLIALREADVFWSTRIWRSIDLREKINQPLYYPIAPAGGRKSLISVVIEGLKENVLTAYLDEEFKQPLTYDEVMSSLEKKRTITVTRPEPPYEEYDSTITDHFDPGSVMMVRLKEDWFFDKQRSVLDVRILGLSLVTTEYDATSGEFKGFKGLFWIYFPEARQILAKNGVYNRHNESERLSYDDVFMKRFFSSYIYKQSNVYDRFISDYATGLDALIEADRIKNEMFAYEHDLWEY